MLGDGSLRDQLRDQSGSYLPRLRAVFFAVFDETHGPKIVSQVPEGTVATALSTFPSAPDLTIPELSLDTTTPTSIPSGSQPSSRNQSTGRVRSTSQRAVISQQVLFDFSSVLEFVIPKSNLCGHLITKATRTSKILGFPVRIDDDIKYKERRNAFLFNVCFVFERDAELSCFEPIVRKVGRSLRTMEESVSLLSSPPPDFSIPNLIEQIYMDINAFSEASIKLHDSYLDLFVLPYHANPRPIRPWDVPIAVAPLDVQKNASWDVSLFKLCDFIDGVTPVKRIAELAEVDHTLARLCIQHLLFYSAIILVDIFQYSNSYAPMPGIADIVQYGEDEDEGAPDLKAECEAYIYNGNAGSEVPPVPFATLLSLYAMLAPGISISTWIDANGIYSHPIDVRRMIQFGVIKGFLRRVYAYPVWLDHPSYSTALSKTGGSGGRTLTRRVGGSAVATAPSEAGDSNISGFQSNPSQFSLAPSSDVSGSRSQSQSRRPRPRPDAPAGPPERTALPPLPLPLGGSNRPHETSSSSPGPPPSAPPSYPPTLPALLDGKHHTDEICVKFGVSFKHLEGMLRLIGGAGEEDHTPVAGVAGGREEEGGMRRSSVTNLYGSRVVMMYI